MRRGATKREDVDDVHSAERGGGGLEGRAGLPTGLHPVSVWVGCADGAVRDVLHTGNCKLGGPCV